MNKPLPPEVEKQLADLVFAGQTIEAIKRYREHSGEGLREAKDFVDALATDLRTREPEKFAPRSTSKGCFGMLALFGLGLLATLGTLFLVLSGTGMAAAADAKPAAVKVRIALAGDSTVTTGGGWGQGFANQLRPGIECLQMARGGRSSKSFRDEGEWQKVLDAKPDYVLIQFGHNDMPGKGPKRETDPATTYPENLGRFVDEVRAMGGKPILVTSMTRRHFKDGKINSDLLAYVAAAKKVAAEKKVPLVDLHTRSIKLFEKLGEEACKALSPIDKKTGKTDTTHLNGKGGEAVGKLVAEDVKKLVPALADCFVP